ncbi:MAG: PIN domain-containing protein [Fimbriimonadales bacterium]|nr:PIN domain-containing protein [Fimbriimonadales bacterium]
MLIDTAGLLCYHHKAEKQHIEAKALFERARYRLTHNYILAEFVPICRVRGLDVTKAIDFVEDLTQTQMLEVVWVTPEIHHQATALLRARPDKTYSLCDAVSFVLMRLKGIQEALTTDKHFEQEGFIRLLTP